MAKFDQTVQQYVNALKIEKRERAGIQVEMPRSNYNYLNKNFEDYLTSSRPDEKVNYLENTLFKRKSLIVKKDLKKPNAIVKRDKKILKVK